MRLAMIGVALVGCVERSAGVTGTQSIGVELVSPADPGDAAQRLPDSLREVRVNLTAYDAASAVDSTFDREVQVYAQFLGTPTPTPTLDDITRTVATPLATVQLTAGKALDRRVVGVIRPVEIGSFNVWIIFPRSAVDVTLE
jgi:hypothetical protein